MRGLVEVVRELCLRIDAASCAELLAAAIGGGVGSDDHQRFTWA